MYLMVRQETVNDGKRELLGIDSMINVLKEEGFNAQKTDKVGWNVLVSGLQTKEEDEYVWKLVEELGAFGYVPTEHIHSVVT